MAGMAPPPRIVASPGDRDGRACGPGANRGVSADLTRIELKVNVPASEVGKIELDGPARVRVDAFPERYFEARAARVDPRPRFTPKDIHMPDVGGGGHPATVFPPARPRRARNADRAPPARLSSSAVAGFITGQVLSVSGGYSMIG